jgi:hypothetical protein
MDVETGAYTGSIEVPFYEQTWNQGRTRETEALLYSFLGAASGGQVFLYFPEPAGYAVLILSANDAAQQERGVIRVDPDELFYNAFYLSPDGILSGLLATEDQVRIVWWRSDVALPGTE